MLYMETGNGGSIGLVMGKEMVELQHPHTMHSPEFSMYIYEYGLQKKKGSDLNSARCCINRKRLGTIFELLFHLLYCFVSAY